MARFSKRQKPSMPKIHDRRATDLLRNAMVVAVEVENPYQKGETIAVVRSIRDDPLADMLSRKVIEVYQFNAGREWQKWYEIREIGPGKGIDPRKEYVDGGMLAMPFSEKSAEALQKMNEARPVLGKIGEALVMDILGRGLTTGQVAAKWGMRTADNSGDMAYLIRHFRLCLDGLAELWGFSGKNKTARA